MNIHKKHKNLYLLLILNINNELKIVSKYCKIVIKLYGYGCYLDPKVPNSMHFKKIIEVNVFS